MEVTRQPYAEVKKEVRGTPSSTLLSAGKSSPKTPHSEKKLGCELPQKTLQEADEHLQQALKCLNDQVSARTSFLAVQGVLCSLKSLASVLMLVVGVALLVGLLLTPFPRPDTLMEAITALTLIMADVGLQARAYVMKEHEMVARFRAKFMRPIKATIEGLEGALEIASIPTIAVLRSGQWRYIPRVLIQPGDTIVDPVTQKAVLGQATDPITSRVRAFFTPTQLPIAVDTTNMDAVHVPRPRNVRESTVSEMDADAGLADSDSDSDDDEEGAYIEALRAENQGPSPSSSVLLLQDIDRWLSLVCLVSCLVAMIVGLLRINFITSKECDRWFLLLDQPACLAITALPISLRLIWRFMDLLGNAHILAVLHGMYEGTHGDPSSHDQLERMGSSEYEMSESRHLHSVKLSVPLNTSSFPVPPTTLSSLAQYAAQTLLGNTPKDKFHGNLSYSRNILQSMASTTVVCVVDKEGIVSEIVPTLEKVLIMRDQSQLQQSRTPNLRPTYNPTPPVPGVSALSQSETQTQSDNQYTTTPIPGEYRISPTNFESEAGGTGSKARAESTPLQMHNDNTMTEAEWEEEHMDLSVGASPWQDTPGLEFEHQPAYEVLDLILDRTSHIKFLDDSWKNHTGALNPIGLCCFLHALQSLKEVADGPVSIRRDNGTQEYTWGKSNKNERIIHDDTIIWGKYLYTLGAEIQISDSTTTGITILKRIHAVRNEDWDDLPAEMEEPSGFQKNGSSTCSQSEDNMEQMASLIIEDNDGNWQLFTIGSANFIVDCCLDYWDGSDCNPLGESERFHLLQTAEQWNQNADLLTIGFAYRPIPDYYRKFITSDPNKVITHIFSNPSECDWHAEATMGDEEDEEDVDESNFYDKLLQGQIFLGFSGMRYQPYHLLCNFVESFRKAGIRFTYVSPKNERKTKSFGEKLGLETDWNCCISLRSRHVNLDEADLKARLPHGIKAIKEHIKKVDNVPLLVSLFCDASANATTKMISVLQDYKEVVCTVGSVLNHNNIHIFQTSNCSMSMMPTVNHAILSPNRAFSLSHKAYFGGLGYGTRHNQSWQEDAQNLESLASLHSTPCAINLPFGGDYPFYTLLCIIRQARMVMHTMGKSAQLLVSANMLIHLILLFGGFLGLAVLSGLQVLWLVFFVVPVISFSIIHLDEGALFYQVMQTIPAKHDDMVRSNILNHQMKYFMLRLGPAVPFLIFVHVATFRSAADLEWSAVFMCKEIHAPPLIALEFAQHVTMMFIVLYLVIHAMGYLSRHKHIRVYRPWRQKRWMIVSALIVIIQAIISLSLVHFYSLSAQPPNNSLLHLITRIGPEVYCVGFSGPVVLCIIESTTKGYRQTAYKVMQKRMKLAFDTKLGAYSPR